MSRKVTCLVLVVILTTLMASSALASPLNDLPPELKQFARDRGLVFSDKQKSAATSSTMSSRRVTLL